MIMRCFCRRQMSNMLLLLSDAYAVASPISMNNEQRKYSSASSEAISVLTSRSFLDSTFHGRPLRVVRGLCGGGEWRGGAVNCY